MKILDEIWYGNIPRDRSYGSGSRLGKLNSLILRYEEELQQLISEKAKEIRAKQQEYELERGSLLELDAFKTGFCLGARITMEVMLETESMTESS